jgi:hypothetical protein
MDKDISEIPGMTGRNMCRELDIFENPWMAWVALNASCSHTKYLVQDSICLQVLRRSDTLSAASTPLSAPRFPPPYPPHLLTTLEANLTFQDFFPAKQTYFCIAKTLFLNFYGF